MYDGEQINAQWGNAWPAGHDVYDTDHEHSPLLQAPVANLLGEPWYLESGSPGGDFVTWLSLPDGGEVMLSPHPDSHSVMRWMICVADKNGSPLFEDQTLTIDVDAEQVAQHVLDFLAQYDVVIPDASQQS